RRSSDLPDRSTAEGLEQITMRVGGPFRTGLMPTTDSPLIQLANFVRLEEARGPDQIERFQRQRKVSIVANLSNYALGDAMNKVREIVAGLNMPPEYQLACTGRAKSFQE